MSKSLASLFAGSDAGRFGRAQRRPRGARIPVSIVTGFLGAGKTTLIRALLDSPAGANTAIVVNEYGEIGIDNALLRASSDATVLLGNGCVCCMVRSDLQESLHMLVADRARGAVPSFARVMIETSGLADPGPLLAELAGLTAAPVERAVNGAIDPAYLLDERLDLPVRIGEHDHAHAHSHGIESFAVTFDAPLAWPAFEQAMTVLTALRGPDLLRVKG